MRGYRDGRSDGGPPGKERSSQLAHRRQSRESTGWDLTCAAGLRTLVQAKVVLDSANTLADQTRKPRRTLPRLGSFRAFRLRLGRAHTEPFARFVAEVLPSWWYSIAWALARRSTGSLGALLCRR